MDERGRSYHRRNHQPNSPESLRPDRDVSIAYQPEDFDESRNYDHLSPRPALSETELGRGHRVHNDNQRGCKRHQGGQRATGRNISSSYEEYERPPDEISSKAFQALPRRVGTPDSTQDVDSYDDTGRRRRRQYASADDDRNSSRPSNSPARWQRQVSYPDDNGQQARVLEIQPRNRGLAPSSERVDHLRVDRHGDGAYVASKGSSQLRLTPADIAWIVARVRADEKKRKSDKTTRWIIKQLLYFN